MVSPFSKHEWLEDVLSDIQAYAQRHDLPRTREVLSDAVVLLHLELAQHSDRDLSTAKRSSNCKNRRKSQGSSNLVYLPTRRS